VIEAFTADDVRGAEQPLLAAERGFAGGLMHRAATALATTVRSELRRRTGRVPGSTVVGLVGPGDNGGDTLHALALLARHGIRVVAVLGSSSVHDGGLAALRATRGRVVGLVADAPGASGGVAEAVALCRGADVVLDGLLGLGGRGGLRDAAAELVAALSEAADWAGGGGPLVVAVDVPSGIGVDDGTVAGPVLRADRTVTFGVVKPGLLLAPAADLAGTVTVVDLGLREVLTEQGRPPAVRRLTPEDVAGRWPVPGSSAHKYTRGVVGVVAGSAAYPGAAVLASAGGLGAGAGMVRFVGPDEVRRAVVAAHPEVVAGDSVDVQVQSWVLGPGVGGDDEQSDRVLAALTGALREGVPAVVDAGALEGLPETLGPLVVLTPHAGELSRLLAARGVAVERAEIEAAPRRWAGEAAVLTGATVLLKGHTTLVVGHTEAGAADVVLAQRDAPAWLATAGAGDVLAGVLGTLLAARADDVRAAPGLVAELAAAAALVCGVAADAANPGGPVTGGEVARSLPGSIAALLAARVGHCRA
jgi:hydroxyethylthiazole kinase-like uncharacterized protein yjeF